MTTLDAEAILRARSAVARPRSRFLSLITGDEADAASAREHQASLAQPSNEVKREMLRLETEARLAAEEAERAALRADAMSQLGIHVDDLPAAEAARLAGHDPVVGSEAPEAADEALDAAEAPEAASRDHAIGDDGVPVEGQWPAELHPADAPPTGEIPSPRG